MLFRNRWLALLWLATTLVSASLFVGDEGGAAKLLDSAKQIKTQREQLRSPPPETSRLIAVEQVDSPGPVLMPAGGLNADPHNPMPGDVFVEAVSGRRVRIVGREARAEPVE